MPLTTAQTALPKIIEKQMYYRHFHARTLTKLVQTKHGKIRSISYMRYVSSATESKRQHEFDSIPLCNDGRMKTCFRSTLKTTRGKCNPQPSRSFWSTTRNYDREKAHTSNGPTLSPRQQAQLEEAVLKAANVLDPLLGKPVRTLGWLRRASFDRKGAAQLTIQVKVPSLSLHTKIHELKETIENSVKEELDKEWKEILGHSEAVNVKIVFSSVSASPYIQQQHENALANGDLSESDNSNQSNISPGLAGTTHIVPVYSCKGGVGKSTISLNLAYAMAHRGIKVGLLDVDVFGPSLPTLVKMDREDSAVRRSPLGSNMVYPITHEGVKMLSLGFVSRKSGVPGAGQSGDIDEDGISGVAVMRGPMASRVVSQLIKGTDWGDLDVLILDLPPGTGDVQLTICQDLDQLSGAVAVTTPSKLALVDARKGIQMFEAMNVPTLALVENMSFFECEHGTRYYPFGKATDSGDAESMAKALGFSRKQSSQEDSVVFQIPISEHTTNSNESGIPLCLHRPSGAEAELKIFDNMANALSMQLFKIQNGVSLDGDNDEENIKSLGNTNAIRFGETEKIFDTASTILKADEKTQSFTVRLFTPDGAAIQLKISAQKLRLTNPKTGDDMTENKSDDINKTLRTVASPSCGSTGHSTQDDIVLHHTQNFKHTATPRTPSLPRLFPVKVERKGKFGYSIEWGDGATIFYSMASIAIAAGGKPVKQI